MFIQVFQRETILTSKYHSNIWKQVALTMYYSYGKSKSTEHVKKDGKKKYGENKIIIEVH